MDNTNCETCYKAFNVLCEELAGSELVATEEFLHWIFERGYMAALEKFEKVQKIDDKFIEAVWSSQPSLEQCLSMR